MKKIYIIICVVLSFLFGLDTKAMHPLDSIEVSLLTCSPGQEVYSYYGHSAIRIKDITTCDDLALNYGVFSFDSPNFQWRFVKGETDYQLGVIPFFLFKGEYERRGSYVVEQKLNLNKKEVAKLIQLFHDNMRPENIVYRYNFLFDNCTTRARDIIEKSIDGKIVYASNNGDSEISYRKIIHQYTERHPWSKFGQDLLLGADCDKAITREKQEFAPFYLKNDFSKAMIVDKNGSKRPLVKEENLCVTVDKANEYREGMIDKVFNFFNPTLLMSLLTMFTAFMVWLGKKRKRTYWQYESIMLLVQGLLGCIVALLFFFSQHPTVGSNWLIIFLNPLPLIYLPRQIYLARHHKQDFYHKVSATVLVAFLALFWAIPQQFPTGALLLALNLLMISVSHIYINSNKCKNKE